MADSNGSPESTLVANGFVNGADGQSRPHTPPNPCMSLTEYSANPKTPAEEKRMRIKRVLPDDYLLEDGNPDVSAPVRSRRRVPVLTLPVQSICGSLRAPPRGCMRPAK